MAKNIPTGSKEINGGIEKLDNQTLGGRFKILGATATAVAGLMVASCAQDVEAQTASTKVEHVVPDAEVVKTAQLSQTLQPKVINASVAIPEVQEKVVSLDEILEVGKAEWMENAQPEFGEETAVVWEELILELDVKGKTTMSKFIVKDLQEFTPKMLTQFANVDKSIYPKIHSMGITQVEKRETEKEKRETEKEKRETEKEKRETEKEKRETYDAKRSTQIAETLAGINRE